jgi:hypothetical protein
LDVALALAGGEAGRLEEVGSVEVEGEEGCWKSTDRCVLDLRLRLGVVGAEATDDASEAEERADCFRIPRGPESATVSQVDRRLRSALDGTRPNPALKP